jgi:hypothetical protein
LTSSKFFWRYETVTTYLHAAAAVVAPFPCLSVSRSRRCRREDQGIKLNLYTATISGLEATPPHLRLLEVAWRGLRKDRMEASLRRRATSITGPSTREGEKVTCASWCDNRVTSSVGEKSDNGDQHRGRTFSGKPINERSDTAARNITRAGQREPPENTTALRPQPPTRAPDRATAVRPKPVDHHAAPQRPPSLLPVRRGVLPPGRYAASKQGYMVIVAPKERTFGLTKHGEIDGFLMTVVGRGLRVEVSTSGLCCMVFRATSRGEEENLRLNLVEQKSWKPEDVRIWKGVSAVVEKVQAATDRVSKHFLSRLVMPEA